MGLVLLVLCCSLVVLGDFPSYGRVNSLPGFGNVPNEQYSGLVTVNTTCPASIFFWLSKSMKNASNVVLWLNGGPGSSSFLGWFFEGIGPFSLDPSQTLKPNPNTWSENVDVLMIDQPAGVGYGVAKEGCFPSNLNQSSDQLFSALITIFNDDQMGLLGKKLFIFGESYAGTWLPLLAEQIVGSETSSFVFGGMGVGDGFVDPLLQEGTYTVMAETHGLISGESIAKTKFLYQKCADAINNCSDLCSSNVNDICNDIEDFIVNVSNVNIYDVRKTGSYDFGYISDYLSRKDVCAALHCDEAALPYESFSNTIGNLFAVGEQNSVRESYTYLLENNVNVLLYNGVYDLDCNFFGTDAWVAKMSWKYAQEFANQTRVPWIDSRKMTAGMSRSLLNLQQLVIYDSGHLVPHDVPVVAKEMMEEFVFKGKVGL